MSWPSSGRTARRSISSSQAADSQGRCHYEIDVPATATVGTGVLKGIAREGGRMSRQNVEFEIIPSS